MNLLTSVLASALLFLSTATAFQVTSPISISRNKPQTILRDTLSEVDELVKKEYPIFYNLILSKNTELWKDLGSAAADTAIGGFTIFAPNDEAMEKLGKKKLDQLVDDRNSETAEKIAAFHAVAEPVGAWDLITSGGIVTVGGVVDVGKSKIGGFFGFGGKEDGGVTVSGSKIIKTTQFGTTVVHEMDGLISPEIMWRYMDQLRIL
mmetsp:Transcript_2608/g.4005  ORF Transcript_2608/g.4005 Transcript_2608/m.4005 type:complete len:206 (-) Transcript_2608:123-740(-)